MTRQPVRTVVALAFSILMAACATKNAPPAAPASPWFPDYPEPVVPASVGADPGLVARHEGAWRRLQAGDVRGAVRDFNDILRTAPGFYPAMTGLGYARLAERDAEQAAQRFETATAAAEDYLPAWLGLVQARLALGRDDDAIPALERVVALDPARTEARARLDLLRFRRLPALIERGREARLANRLDEARKALDEALALSPASGVILAELALVEVQAGDVVAALRRAQRAVEVDPNNGEAHAALAAAYDAGGNRQGAAASYARAAELDGRPEWRAKANALVERARLSTMPAEFKDLPKAETVTRGQAAAYVGIHLGVLLERAPARSTQVATDVRDHWAADHILAVTRAGVMDVLPNHTFQPATTLRRGDLAQVVARLLAMIPLRQMDLARWRSAKPRFADLPATNVFYQPAALSVASGAMTTRSGSRFDPAAPASGADLAAAIARVEEIAGR